MSGLVGSIPMHSRHLQPSLVGLPPLGSAHIVGLRRLALLAALGCALLTGQSASAQQVDSAKVGARRPSADTARKPQPASDSARKPLPKPPLSPRRAFLYSLAIPGYSQAVLNRPTAGALFVLTEAIAIAMLRESTADLREARRFQTDSLITIGFEPSGTPITAVSGYTQHLVDVRRSHVEDWIAFIIANHLFAGADGYVAAHLWDLPTQISVERRPAGTVVAAKLRW
ncbi:MAG TPA: hypothetical protein VF488_00200 [Gemmatimonadaceae bacterium]